MARKAKSAGTPASRKNHGNITDTLPKGETGWFVQDRFGMFIHWGTYAAAARHEWVKSHEKIPTEPYLRYFNHFDPDLYDPGEWARMAREAGMRYFVITTKHHEGFCLWDTQHTEYKATNTPGGRDLLKPMVEAFRAEGLKVGFYYSLIDWHHQDFTTKDFHHPMRENAEEHQADTRRDMKRYAKYMRDQVKELLTGFGKIDMIWFDFSYPTRENGKGRADWESEKLYALVRELQPGIMINNRLDLPGSADFLTPEQFQPPGPVCDEDGNPVVWEACQTFSGSWGYHRDENTWKSVDQLLWMLIDGVSKNGNLLLNVGPTARGEFDDRARERLAGMGEWMKRHGRAIYGCGAAPAGMLPPADCRYTYAPATNRLYVHLLAWPFKHLHLPGLGGRVEYAQFLHDGSEIMMQGLQKWQYENSGVKADSLTLSLQLPIVKPRVAVPVIELFLK